MPLVTAANAFGLGRRC